MIKIGQYNTLTVARCVEFGVYLTDDIYAEERSEVLLPARYAGDGLNVGDQVDCFVYNDSEDRLVATTERPYATVGEFAFLQVVQVNNVGAFMDWGLPKDLLVPFREQKSKMIQGGVYPVYVYLDDVSGRVTATAKIEHYVGNVMPRLKPGTEVKALIVGRTPIGYKAIVNNLHRGMIFENTVFSPIAIGDKITAYVKKVRDDGKIDLSLSGRTLDRIILIAEKIEKLAKSAEGNPMILSDSASPEEIKATFGCSKKDYKKALGYLYKSHKIEKPEK